MKNFRQGNGSVHFAFYKSILIALWQSTEETLEHLDQNSDGEWRDAAKGVDSAYTQEVGNMSSELGLIVKVSKMGKPGRRA